MDRESPKALCALVLAAAWMSAAVVHAQDPLAMPNPDPGSVGTAVDRVSAPTDSATAGVETTFAVNRVNRGVGFWMICRGGPGLRISSGGSGPAPAWMNLPPWASVSTLVMDFRHSPLPPDRSGRNLQPGECSPEDFQFRTSDLVRIQQVMVLDGQWERSMDGLPEDKSPNVAERYPDITNVPPYLRDPNHYWRFGTADHGEGYLQSGYSRSWTPAMYQGPPPTSPTATKTPRGPTRIIDAARGNATETTARNDAVRDAVNAPPDPPICVSARSARARNSPAAPGLERQCREQGGTP